MDTGFGCLRPHELRAIERRILLDALAEQLPPGTIRFNSRVKRIMKVDGVQGVTQLELQDGTVYSSKVSYHVFAFSYTISLSALNSLW
jgi:hypothetical protein